MEYDPNYKTPTEAAIGAQLPPQPAPAQPSAVVTPTNSGSPSLLQRLLSKRLLLILAGVLVLVGLIIFIGFFVVVVQGKTLLGQKMQDQIWEAQIESMSTRQAEYLITTAYRDSGTFTFTPSLYAKKAGFSENPEELKKWDEDFSFTLNNMSLAGKLNMYIDLVNPDQPKTDSKGEVTYINKEIEYSGTYEVKLTEKELFTKYQFNEAVHKLADEHREYTSEYESDEGKWVRTSDEYDIKSMIDALKSFNPLNDPTNNPRDAQRYADIRQLQSALELYFNDFGGYPESIDKLAPETEGSPTQYLQNIPVAPTPADGTCTDEMNVYQYSPRGDETVSLMEGATKESVFSDFEITFCVGNEDAYSSLKGGNKIANRNGISDYICPEGKVCSKENESLEEPDNEYKAMLKRNRIFNIKTMSGVSLINGTPVMHYKLELDKDKLRKLANEDLEKSFKDHEISESNKQFARDVTEVLIERTELDHNDLYVGVTDRKVYKTDIAFKVISLTKTLQLVSERYLRGDYDQLQEDTLGSAREKSRDAKRVADIRQMQSAMELYFNDYGSYPAGKDGKPIGLDTAQILVQLPESPTPPDGTCDDYYNTYWYEPGPGQPADPSYNKGLTTAYASYTLSFCIGETTGGLSPGIQIASESGIQSKNPIAIPEGADERIQAEENYETFIKAEVLKLLRDTSFDAILSFSNETKNAGKEKAIELPTDFIEKKSYQYDYPLVE